MAAAGHLLARLSDTSMHNTKFTTIATSSTSTLRPKLRQWAPRRLTHGCALPISTSQHATRFG
jgi:hypothetical protein